MGASGQWLAQPTAVLRATDSTGSRVSALLSLAEPRYSAARRTLVFKARPPALLLPSHLPTAGLANSPQAQCMYLHRSVPEQAPVDPHTLCEHAHRKRSMSPLIWHEHGNILINLLGLRLLF